MSIINVSILNPLTNELITDVSANSKSTINIEDGKKILETYIIVNVELDENNNPIFDSNITGRKIDM